MKKRPVVAVLNAIEATRLNLIESNGEWMIVKTDAAKELLLGPFRIGKLVRTDSFDPVAEVSQITLIDAASDKVKETIVAATRYRLEIGNPDDKYESHRRFPIVHAYTTAAALSGNADTDRLNVYTALAGKVNGYATNNATAYTLTYVAFTLGGSVGDASTNYVAGELVTQATSSETARIAKSVITSGTMAGDNAAGDLWLFDISSIGDWLETAVTLTAATSSNCIVTQTNATTVHGTGLAIEDASGYFTSSIGRAGLNWVGVTQGFSIAAVEVGLTGAYAMGIGSVMAALAPVYDHSNQDVVRGFLEYELANSDDAFDVAKTYRKYVFTINDGDEDAMAGERQHGDTEVTLYCDYSELGGDLDDLDTAIGNLT